MVAGHVDVIGRTERLAQHVGDAGLFEDGAGGTTGDHAGTRSSGLQHDPAGAELTDRLVDDRRAAIGTVNRLRRASSVPFWMAVALPWPCRSRDRPGRHRHRSPRSGERETTTALDDLGHSVDVDDAGLAEAFAPIARVVAFVTSVESHQNFSPPAGGVGECRDPAVVAEATAVEHDLFDASRLYSASRAPALVAASMLLFTSPRRADSVVDADARAPAMSSMTWAEMCLLERNTAMRSLSRPRRSCGPGCDGECDRRDASLRKLPWLLGRLSGLADHALVLVADALALVRLRLAPLADIGGHLADELLSMPFTKISVWAGTSNSTPSGASIFTGWLKPRDSRALEPGRGAPAPWIWALHEALAHADDHVLDE